MKKLVLSTKKQEVMDYIYITIGMILYSFAITGFIVPYKIVGGGVTGLCTVIYYLSSETMPVGISYFIINTILLVIGMKVLGPKFGLKTIFAILAGTVFMTILQHYIHEPMVKDVFMGAIIAAMMIGVSIAIALGHGGSTGGTDIIAMIVTKRYNISLGKVMTYCDIVIIATTLFINPSIEGLMYGYVVMGIAYTSLDYVMTGRKQSFQIIINSDNYEEIAEAISSNFKRGITILDGQGWYTRKPKKLLMIVVRKSEANSLLRMVKMIDPKVFITMESVSGVYGEGFDDIKLKVKKERKVK